MGVGSLFAVQVGWAEVLGRDLGMQFKFPVVVLARIRRLQAAYGLNLKGFVEIGIGSGDANCLFR